MTADSPSSVVPKLRFPEFRDAPGWSTPRGDTLFDSINNRNAAPGLPVLAITQEYGAIPRDQIDYHVSVTEQSVASYKEVCEGDFIISLRSFQGGIEYSRYHGICSPAYVILRRKGKGTDHFFRRLFKSDRFIQQLTRNIEGIRDGKMISYEQFSEQLLPVPNPREQQKIADCLDSLDDLIVAEGRKLEALRQHKQGLMQVLFPQSGETVPRLRFPEFEDAPEWRVAPLGDLFDMATGGTPDRSRSEYWDGEVPWVTTSIVDFNVIESTKEFISEAGLSNSAAKVFPKRTVLMALYGQGKTRGKVAMLGIEAATNQACVAILPSDDIDPRFVFLNLGGRYEEIRAVSNSGGQQNLSQALVRDLLFAYPESRVEQERIADCLTALDNQFAAQARRLDALKRHKMGLLQKLFPALEVQ